VTKNEFNVLFIVKVWVAPYANKIIGKWLTYRVYEKDDVSFKIGLKLIDPFTSIRNAADTEIPKRML